MVSGEGGERCRAAKTGRRWARRNRALRALRRVTRPANPLKPMEFSFSTFFVVFPSRVTPQVSERPGAADEGVAICHADL